MPRSPRTQSLLLAAFAALLLVTGAAFATTFGSQLTWQQRDAVSASAGEYAFRGGEEPAVTARVTVTNPLDRPVAVGGAELVVYDGEAPFRDDERLTSASGTSIADVTVPADGERTVAVRMPVVDGAADAARAAVEDGSASASGVIRLRLFEREFSVDV